MSQTALHALDLVTPEEITRAVAIIRDDARFEADSVFVHVRLYDPPKDADPSTVDRELEALLVPPGARLEVADVVVSVTSGEIRSWTVHDGMRPALMFGESLNAILGVAAHPDWQAALRRRGIPDDAIVQIDPWPAGSFGVEHEAGRRISRCIAFLRESDVDNGYARPIEGLIAFFDNGAGEVLEVVDLGVVPLPPERGSYLPDDVGPMRDGLQPLEIVQPEGPSFTVDGNLVQWQRWSFRVGFDPYEGLVLHTVAYHDGDRARPVLHRASVCEMVVPYGDPGPMHGWKNAFDAGEWGLGRMMNSLKLGCDCLGTIHYFDVVLATEQGEPYTVEQAICLHEEDYGILWKHVDQRGGTDEVRRSRRLVVSFVATVGNYEYGFYWYFYLDGNIQLEVKLTGIVSAMAVVPGEHSPFANVVAPGVAAPHHQHLFSARLDLDVDGPVNDVYEVEAEPLPPGPDNPWANAFAQKETRLETELGAQRDVNPATSRTWRVVNPASTNRLGQPVGYKLVPTMSTPTMLASPDSSVGRRAGFARHNLWVTPYRRDERRAAGEFPNQHAGGDGLPRWTADDRAITGTDVVLWYTFGVTHFVRPEDWPVMPVEYTGFLLQPVGFFDRNPALDVPPQGANGSCHV
ncbi:MAG TPA: primary-amine oxidase [Acidimicrobiia bacterium]|nr:primary-amine oxidase [Acidimicrobiia bacterium]